MKLLYAIDIRDDALWHLDEVNKWAERLDATVDFIYVNAFGDYAPYVLDPELNRALKVGIDKARKADHKEVSRAMNRLPEARRGVIHITSGDAAERIAEAAQDYDAVLLATRANQGIRRLWLGSVAERVLRLHKGTSIVMHA